MKSEDATRRVLIAGELDYIAQVADRSLRLFPLTTRKAADAVRH